MNDDTKIATVNPETAAAPAEGFTLNISGQNPSYLWGEVEVYRQQMKSGARWFYWIAGLSLINSIAALSNSSWSFLAGLGVTQFISGFAIGLSNDLGSAVTVVAMILDVIVAGFFVLLGVLAMKGHTWAFMLGLVLYALDGLIFLAFQMWFPLAFHVFVVYCLYKGFAANRKLKLLEAEIAAATPGTVP